jgi:glycosyltransferase involved in cell wall biosynthesis
MKVAYYSPLPPSPSGIADYSALLLPALRERIEEVAIAQPGKRRPHADISLYHIGNNPEAHGWILHELRRQPGIVVLHEFVLHHLIAGITIARGDKVGYLDAMDREAGLPGRLLAQAVAEGLIERLWETRPQDFPLAREALDFATGVIVHSKHLEERVRDAGYRGPVWRIPMAAWPVPEVTPVTVEGAPLFGCFGHLVTSKRIPQLLEAFARVRASRPGARLLLVGPRSPHLEELSIPEGVTREEYVPEDRLWALMAACDVHVCLRWPSMGETSAVVVRALSLGKPLIVSDVGSFSELPDDAVLKVPIDEVEVETLAAALEFAVDHAGQLGEAAARHARSEHDLGRVADAYTGALEQAAGGDAVNDAVLWRIAEAAAEVGVDDAGELVRQARDSGIVA